MCIQEKLKHYQYGTSLRHMHVVTFIKAKEQACPISQGCAMSIQHGIIRSYMSSDTCYIYVPNTCEAINLPLNYIPVSCMKSPQRATHGDREQISGSQGLKGMEWGNANGQTGFLVVGEKNALKLDR